MQLGPLAGRSLRLLQRHHVVQLLLLLREHHHKARHLLPHHLAHTDGRQHNPANRPLGQPVQLHPQHLRQPRRHGQRDPPVPDPGAGLDRPHHEVLHQLLRQRPAKLHPAQLDTRPPLPELRRTVHEVPLQRNRPGGQHEDIRRAQPRPVRGQRRHLPGYQVLHKRHLHLRQREHHGTHLVSGVRYPGLQPGQLLHAIHGLLHTHDILQCDLQRPRLCPDSHKFLPDQPVRPRQRHLPPGPPVLRGQPDLARLRGLLLNLLPVQRYGEPHRHSEHKQAPSHRERDSIRLRRLPDILPFQGLGRGLDIQRHGHGRGIG